MSDKLPDYVHITTECRALLGTLLEQINPDKVGLLVDENTKANCLPLLDPEPDTIIEIRSGEANKNLDTCQLIWENLTTHAFTRKSLLINLGGGVIGDMGGFAAASYKRGIPFINMPTTLLSQVDASIGGKLGVDFMGLKNHIGVFQNPDAVVIDPAFLQTLPGRELISGFAEVVKHALIRDAQHWDHLRQTSFEELDWKQIIPRSVAIKNEVVKEDPLEKGLRKILNFGHTLGHAVESYFMNTENSLLHGEAIAVGMILESHLSVQLDLLSEKEFEDISRHVKGVFSIPISLPDYRALQPYLLQDKKNEKGVVHFSLLDKIGSCTYNQIASEKQITQSLRAYENEIR